MYLCRYWIAPVGKALGIKSTGPKPPKPNKVLEAAYNVNARLSHKTVRIIGGLSIAAVCVCVKMAM